MPVPCKREIFSSRVISLRTMLARSSGVRAVFIHACCEGSVSVCAKQTEQRDAIARILKKSALVEPCEDESISRNPLGRSTKSILYISTTTFRQSVKSSWTRIFLAKNRNFPQTFSGDEPGQDQDSIFASRSRFTA